MVEAAQENIKSSGKFDFDAGKRRQASTGVDNMAAELDASFLRPEGIFNMLDGGDANGVWSQAIWQLIARAQRQEADLMGDIVNKVVEVFEEMPIERRKRLLADSVMIESMGRQIIGEERRWQAVLQELYEASSAIGPGYWTHTDFRALLDKLIPQSWACRRYGKEHRCEFEWMCFLEPGWEDPLAARMQLRRPHHDREAQQMRERGLQVPDEWDEDDE